MIVNTRQSVTLPVGTIERLEVPDVVVGGYADPTSLTVETQLSAAAVTPSQGEALDPDGFEPAAWADASTIRTHLLTGVAEGTWGLWVRITAGDEVVVRHAGRVIFS